MKTIVALLILSPFLGFIINSVRPWKLKTTSLIACGACAISFMSSLFLFFTYSGSPTTVSFFPWIQWATLNVSFSFLLDPISLLMILIVSGVGFLIHIFSVEYMNHDERPARYFSYLNLFLFNMLVLVLSDNLLLLFVGWEGVGLCSYLLIGFWYKDASKAAAGMKAFIANRIGDAAFLIGMFLFFSLFHSLNFLSLGSLTLEPSLLLTATCICLFIGAAGKSAQFPLYVWLPSAMAGPTPVSALIHAATMVTAGIYLVLRTLPIWTASPIALHIIAVIGLFTALIGAYQACRVWDVKKILAYSTVSQLGYMFLAIGVGAFASAFFHLLTHAFFKACLFLSAGSLIHGMNGEQDIRKMGGLKKKMPCTFWSFLIGSLALMGLPPLSGFFSKDEILYNTFNEGHFVFWALALIGAGMTAFYTTKALYFIFFKKPSETLQAHEGGSLIKIPLVTLAFFSVVTGALSWPHFLPHILPHQWLGNFTSLIKSSSEAHNTTLEIILAVSSALFILAIVGLTLFIVKTKMKPIALLSKLVWNWSLDQFYKDRIVLPTLHLSKVMFKYIESQLIQLGIRKLGDYFASVRKGVVSFQNGVVQNYLLLMSIGILFFIFSILWK